MKWIKKQTHKCLFLCSCVPSLPRPMPDAANTNYEGSPAAVIALHGPPALCQTPAGYLHSYHQSCQRGLLTPKFQMWTPVIRKVQWPRAILRVRGRVTVRQGFSGASSRPRLFYHSASLSLRRGFCQTHISALSSVEKNLGCGG